MMFLPLHVDVAAGPLLSYHLRRVVVSFSVQTIYPSPYGLKMLLSGNAADRLSELQRSLAKAQVKSQSPCF
jgi:hypothetical protein